MRRRKCVKCVRLKTFFSKIMLLMDAFIPGKSVSYDKVRSPARCWVNSLPKFGFGDGFASSRLQRFPRVEGARRVREGADSCELSQTQAFSLSKLVFSFSNVELRNGWKLAHACGAGFGRGRRSISFERGTQEFGKLRCGFSFNLF